MRQLVRAHEILWIAFHETFHGASRVLMEPHEVLWGLMRSHAAAYEPYSIKSECVKRLCRGVYDKPSHVASCRIEWSVAKERNPKLNAGKSSQSIP